MGVANRKLLRMVAIAGALLFNSSCDGVPRTLAGGWVGYDGNRRVLLFLEDVEGEVTGRGMIEKPYGEIHFDGVTRDGDDLLLDVTVATRNGLSFGDFRLVIRDEALTGELFGLAFETDTITLVRWPSRVEALNR